MNIQHFQLEKFFYAQIDNLYTKEELQLMQKEIEFLETIKQSPEHTSSAYGKDGKVLKTGSGIFIDCIYTNRSTSKLLTFNRKLFSDDLVDKLTETNCVYKHIQNSDRDTTLINFYGPAEQYKEHCDKTVFTAVTFFGIGSFSGGNLCFTEHDVLINPVIGRTVIFPGFALHKAEPIIADIGNYRVTMAQFINYK